MKKLLSSLMLGASVLLGGINTIQATTTETTAAKAAATSASITAADFCDLSGGRASRLKRDSAMISALTKKGFKMTSSKFYPGDPDADLVVDQDDVTVKTYSKGGIKVTLTISEHIVWNISIQFPSSSQASAFASKLRSVGVTENSEYFILSVQGSKVSFGPNAG